MIVYSLIEVDQTIITVDSENQHYMTLTREDLSVRCKQIDYVCEHINPIYHESINLLREIQLYVQNSNFKMLCNTRYIESNHTIWITLKNQRSWLYFIPYEQTIIIDCKNREEYTRTKIVRTGRIALYGECKLTTADMIIKTIGSYNHLNSFTKVQFNPFAKTIRGKDLN